MTTRRDVILEELGLGPSWHLRGRAAPVGETKTGESIPSAEPAIADSVDRPASNATGVDAMDWETLQRAVSTCTACALAKTRTQTVFGVGDPHAEWLLVGEAPGAEEDARGEPFVGQAGRLLDNILAAVDLKRGEHVYIANVLKCRPPGNRNPEPQEVARCSPYLERQIALIRPKLIVAMGRFAAQTLLETDTSIASLRGRLHRYRGVPLIVTYHPAYLLRNLPDKAKVWEDLIFARKTLAQLKAGT